MSNFEEAFHVVLIREGGLVDDHSDPGGITKYGISLRWLQTVQPDAMPSTIINLTVTQAQNLYKTYFWHYDAIRDQGVAAKVFDMAVNLGPSSAHKVAQTASGTFPDGILGPKSILAINSSPRAALLQHIRSLEASHYESIVSVHPEDTKFLKGWLRRAQDEDGLIV